MSKLDKIPEWIEFDPLGSDFKDVDPEIKKQYIEELKKLVKTGPKCKPIEGLGSGFPRMIQKENLFVNLMSNDDTEYGIQLDYKSGEFYEYDKVSKLIKSDQYAWFKQQNFQWLGTYNGKSFTTRYISGVGLKGGSTGERDAVYPLYYPSWDTKNIITTHTHPNHGAFSEGDFLTPITSAIEMRAITKWYVHSLQRPDNIDKWSSTKYNSNIRNSHPWVQKYISNKWMNTMNRITKPFERSGKNNFLNPDLIEDPYYMKQYKGSSWLTYGEYAELTHLIVQTVAAELGFPYSRVRRKTNLESDEIKNDFPTPTPEPTPVPDQTQQPTPTPVPGQTQQPRPIQKKIQVDVRYDIFPKNPRDRAKTGTNQRRNPYPWEDRNYFEKMRKENEAKKDELETTGNKQTAVESESPTQKRKAKTKGVKEMIEIVEPQKFDWVPLGRRAIGYGGDGGTDIYGGKTYAGSSRVANNGNWHPNGWKFKLVPGAEGIQNKDRALSKVSSRNTEGYPNGKLPGSMLVSIPGECQSIICLMHYQAAPNYIAMRNAAKKDGIIISYNNCYRPYQNQIDNWFSNTRPLGERERWVSKPTFSGGKQYGTREEVIATNSNHGFGKAIDVSYYANRGVGSQIDQDNAQKWINMNGDRFGWYWGDASDEDWHFVYVG